MMDRETLIDVENLERDVDNYLEEARKNIAWVKETRKEIADLKLGI